MGNIINDMSLIGPFVIKGLIWTVVITLIGWFFAKKSYQEPEDDM